MEVSLLVTLSSTALADELTQTFQRLTRQGGIGFFDGHTCGLAGGVYKVEELEQWFRSRQITSYQLVEDYHPHAHRFAAMAHGASCLACRSAKIQYMPTFSSGLESEQVVCRSCGGMFEAATFFEGKIAHFVKPRAYSYERPDCLDPLRAELLAFSSGYARTSISSSSRCKVEYLDGRFVLADLPRPKVITTRLNGEYLIEPRPLEDGDVIELLPRHTLNVEILPRG